MTKEKMIKVEIYKNFTNGGYLHLIENKDCSCFGFYHRSDDLYFTPVLKAHYENLVDNVISNNKFEYDRHFSCKYMTIREIYNTYFKSSKYLFSEIVNKLS